MDYVLQERITEMLLTNNLLGVVELLHGNMGKLDWFISFMASCWNLIGYSSSSDAKYVCSNIMNSLFGRCLSRVEHYFQQYNG